jgi:iron complex transport system substrate-binding protein
VALCVRRCRSLSNTAAVAAVGITLAISTAARTAETAHKPTRIVSINLCADELVLRLAEIKNVVSVSYLSLGRGSNVIDLAGQIPVNHGLAEEIIPLNPDLVVAGIYSARPAVALLKRVNIPVLDLDTPRSIPEMLEQYRKVGEALGEGERTKEVVGQMEARLAAMPQAGLPPLPHALAYISNGITLGLHSLTNDIIAYAGLENLARTLGVDTYAQISLETVVTSPVDVLILSDYGDVPAIATEVLRHPVLQAISGRIKVMVMPSHMRACAGPQTLDAIDLLRAFAKPGVAAGVPQ